MLILLPPSEGKEAARRGAALDLESLAFADLTPAREQVIDALTDLAQRSEAAEVLGLGPTQAVEVERNAALREAPTMRADRVYTGVLYDALDLATLDAAARRRATRRLAVTSSVFGLLRPADRIPAYRLAGDVTLPGLGGVAAHWRAHLPAVLEDAVGPGLLVDLRSQTYVAFAKPTGDLAARTATVRVLHESNGKRSVVSHFNKATKGRIVRALLSDGGSPRTPAGFATQLRDLGWTVEESPAGPQGTRLDVVVREV